MDPNVFRPFDASCTMHKQCLGYHTMCLVCCVLLATTQSTHVKIHFMLHRIPTFHLTNTATHTKYNIRKLRNGVLGPYSIIPNNNSVVNILNESDHRSIQNTSGLLPIMMKIPFSILEIPHSESRIQSYTIT